MRGPAHTVVRRVVLLGLSPRRLQEVRQSLLGEPIHYAANERLRSLELAPGDIVYLAANDAGHLVIAGAVVVAHLAEGAEASKAVGEPVSAYCAVAARPGFTWSLERVDHEDARALRTAD